MRVGWLIDVVAFPQYHDELAEAIAECGHTPVSVHRPAPPYHWDDVGCSYRDEFEEGACVVAHGDIDLVARVSKDKRWCPGVFATVENYFCSSYFPRFADFLLNADYKMLRFNDLSQQADSLFDKMSIDGELFVRPDSPLKCFDGQKISKGEFEKDLDFLAFNEFPEDSVVIVSSPKEIEQEWRFVVAKCEVVAGSRYHDGRGFVAEPASDPVALDFAKEIAEFDYQPDPVWVLDVAKTANGDYRLLEIGGFSFASLYGCEKKAVVEAVSDVAASIHSGKP